MRLGKYRVMLSLGLVTLLVTLLLVWHPFKPRESASLLIWTTRGVPELQQLAREYQQRTGVRVRIEAPADFVARFELLAQQGQGPDIVIWAHDRFAAWYQAGLLEPVALNSTGLSGCREEAVSALRQGNSLMGYPLQLETLLLFWNPRLLTHPPADLTELATIDTQVPRPLIAWDLTSAYYTWPYITAGAADVLQAQPGKPMRLRASHNSEVLQNLSQLQQGIQQHWLAADMNYEQIMARFSRGELAMMLGGPWDRQRLDQAGIHYRLAAVPALSGRAAQPFFGVIAAGINSQSQEKMLAREFLEQSVLSPHGMAIYRNAKDAGLMACAVPQAASGFENALALGIDKGVAMPGHIAMPLFWNSMQSALSNMFQQRQSAVEALQGAELRINQH